MSFIKRVLSTLTGIILFCMLCVIGLVIIGLIAGSGSSETVQVKPNSVLNLKLDFPVKDYAGKVEFKEYSFLNESKKNGLFNIIDAIKYAATDDNIKGITIENNFVDAGITQVKALRGALLKFKESGKFVVAYSDVYTQKDYYLSSVADTVFINPAGMMEFKGLYSERLYFKDFQEKSGVKMEVVRLGKYKSAVEPFLTNEMSDNNREQITVYLNSLWKDMKADISLSRHVSVEKLNVIADSLLARNPKLAKTSGLVDKIAYYDEYVNGMRKAIGVKEKEELESVSILDYSRYASTKIKDYSAKDRIAVIYAQGNIIYGEGDENSIGQGAMNKSLKEAREDDKVKAVVLRINSPGGSALASELIWREIELTKKVKPVIVSMGDLAASGGYYIASNANKIIAEPSTITGSIGVFGMLPNGKQLSENMGINAEQVITNKNAVTYSFFEPLNEEQRAFIKEGIIDIYDLFSTRVADGRNLTREQVEAIAQGRVWTGADAISIGLVDELGGLDLALKRAAETAEIEKYRIDEYPVFEKDLDKMLREYGLVKAKETILEEELGTENYKMLKEIKAMTEKKGVQLLFPFSTEIK
ncbi:signal peptide peptidase SppA [Tamlana sp. 2_MG-2023]|uniref:signal peptide peptidase SppA n=1 Tax=unclassified Tamlana TaxID=2614803 RepID=UPI0026E245F2|nr:MULTISPECIES: signal peptide peptidase SppA [unclassified Tamlana]MDO6759350.1 signal peptide peptidase SppA [Tamlana sp. 2_MG-2023]MDO6790511.1 signal peptide peptidase SppA [Tamlana sp. 1_MG-2023]